VHTLDFGSFGSSCLPVCLEGPRGIVRDDGSLVVGGGGLLPINILWVGGVVDGRWVVWKGKAGDDLVGIEIGIGCEVSFGMA